MSGLIHSTVVDQSDYSISYILTARQAHDCIIEGIQNQCQNPEFHSEFRIHVFNSMMFDLKTAPASYLAQCVNDTLCTYLFNERSRVRPCAYLQCLRRWCAP